MHMTRMDDNNTLETIVLWARCLIVLQIKSSFVIIFTFVNLYTISLTFTCLSHLKVGGGKIREIAELSLRPVSHY